MTQHKKFKARLEEINRLADALEARRSDLQESAAIDAGFPVKITGTEVDLAVDYLRTLEQDIPWIENGEPYGTVATIFAYDAPAVVLGRLGPFDRQPPPVQRLIPNPANSRDFSSNLSRLSDNGTHDRSG